MDKIVALFNKLLGLLPAALVAKVGADKIMHFIGGIFAGAVGGVLAVVLSGTAIWSVALAAVAGIGKEAFDMYKNKKAKDAGLPAPHTVDVLDAMWTVTGGVVVAVILTFALGIPSGFPADMMSTPVIVD